MDYRKKAIEILKWSGYLTDETGSIMWKKFFWTDVAKKILLVLRHSKGGLIGITGLQGIGKTTTLYALKHELEKEGNDCFFVKWTSNWMETVSADIDWKDDPFYDEYLRNEYTSKTGRVYRRQDIGMLEKMLGKGTVKKIREKVILETLADANYVFVDFPDYNKESIRQMNIDLDSFQDTWRLLQKNYKTEATFVLAIQAELMKQHKHFLWGKMQIHELRPLTAKETIELYLRYHKTHLPFEKEALHEIAKLSQGFFRRLMSYIGTVVSQYVIDKRNNTITVEDVKKLIPAEKVVSDMEQQLVALFPDDVQHELASQVLELLQQKGTLTQKQLALTLNVTQNRISNVVKKMDNNLITRNRGKGKTWLVSLK